MVNKERAIKRLESLLAIFKDNLEDNERFLEIGEALQGQENLDAQDLIYTDEVNILEASLDIQDYKSWIAQVEAMIQGINFMEGQNLDHIE